MMTRRPAPFLTTLLLLVAGCDAGPTTDPSGLAVVRMTIAGHRYDLEVADTETTRERGLMERDTLADDHGMIFVFDREQPLNFWMHHTRFPLDIIYTRADGTVVSVHTMKPYDETNVPSGGEAKYAIELPAGKAVGVVKPGDQLTLPTLPTTAPAK